MAAEAVSAGKVKSINADKKEFILTDADGKAVFSFTPPNGGIFKISARTRDKDGNAIDGNAEKVTDITDVWTFARDITSRDPNWKLLATEAGQ